jgi:putative ABC transport system permease protein
MTTLLAEIRLACRSLSKTLGFAVSAVGFLALGMTLCTAAAAVLKAYLLEQLPYPASERLYSIRYAAPGQRGPAEMERLDWSSLSDVIEHPVAWDLDMFYMLGGDHAEAVPGAWVTDGFMEALGIRPALGHTFTPDAFAAGGPQTALISHRFWTTRFGGDPGVVGRTISAYVSDRPQEAERFTVIGVLPANFWHINPYTDILAPLHAPTYPYLARLQPGVTPQRAAERIATLVRSGARNVPENWTPTVVATHAEYVQRTSPMLWTAGAAAAMVLLVGCANVAALLLVRAVRRQKDLAVRVALGAGTASIARMLFAEALVLTLSATAAAMVASELLLRMLAPAIQQQLGRTAPGGIGAFAFDLRTLAAAAVIAAATVLVCTLAPLATSLRPGLQQAMQGGSRSTTEGPRSRRLRSALVAVEIAVSLTLLVGSSLMLRTVVALLHTDFGFTADRVLVAGITLRQNRYPESASRLAAFERIESSVAALPGVEGAGLTTAWPVQQPNLQTVETAGASSSLTARTGVHRVNAVYFPALGIPLVTGRMFAPSDRMGSEAVVLVSESLAARLWPTGDAVGKRMAVPQEDERGEPGRIQRTVVGIVADVRQGPADEELADAYVPIAQVPGRFAFVLTRTAGDPAALVSPFRAAFRAIDPEISVANARPLQEIVDELVARPRFLASLLTAFAAIAAALTLVGVYGIVAYAVRQRQREIAVRMALGASPGRVTRLFIRQSGVMLAAGVVLGVLAATLASRTIESQLYGVRPGDPVTLAAAVAAFSVAGLFAIWWPSRRAAAMDPAEALRSE